MAFRYDRDTDTLDIVLGSKSGKSYEFKKGSFSIFIDDADSLIKIKIREASHFVAKALAAGVTVEGLATLSADLGKPVWEDVDSSMMSAFRYDEKHKTLEVVFKRTGVYRYFDVPLDVIEGLRKASSKGSYLRAMVIDLYPVEKAK